MSQQSTTTSEHKGFKKIPQPPNTKIYVVEPKDTLMGVAIKFNMTVGALTQMNRIYNNYLFPGMKLYVKDDGDQEKEQQPTDQNNNSSNEKISENRNIKTIDHRHRRSFNLIDLSFERSQDDSRDSIKSAPERDTNPTSEDMDTRSETMNSKEDEMTESQDLMAVESPPLKKSRNTTTPPLIKSEIDFLENSPILTSNISTSTSSLPTLTPNSPASNLSPPIKTSTTSSESSFPYLSSAFNFFTGSTTEPLATDEKQEDWIQEEDIEFQVGCFLKKEADNSEVYGTLTASKFRLDFQPQGDQALRIKLETKDISNALYLENEDPSISKFEVTTRSTLRIVLKKESWFYLWGVTKIFDFRMNQERIYQLLDLIQKTRERRGSINALKDSLSFFKAAPKEKEVDPTEGDEKLAEALQQEEDEKVIDAPTLPTLDQPSRFLKPDHLEILAGHVPKRFSLNNWVLIYSTFLHGMSINTFYYKMNLYQGPSILVVEDQDGSIFGGYASDSFRIQQHFFGTGECFLFQLEPRRTIYPWSHLNDYFLFGGPDSIGFGGGSHGRFGLWLDRDFYNGSSSKSETFGNQCLSNKQDFICKGLEVWGFQEFKA